VVTYLFKYLEIVVCSKGQNSGVDGASDGAGRFIGVLKFCKKLGGVGKKSVGPAVAGREIFRV
jgi:hypothetical protein